MTEAEQPSAWLQVKVDRAMAEQLEKAAMAHRIEKGRYISALEALVQEARRHRKPYDSMLVQWQVELTNARREWAALSKLGVHIYVSEARDDG